MIVRWIFLLVSINGLFANMASPKTGGSIQGDIILSKDVDVVAEKIWISVSKDFQGAKFDIEYSISNSNVMFCYFIFMLDIFYEF